MLKQIFRITLKIVIVALLLFIGIIATTNVSAIYDFAEPRPFSGPDIYNPYRNLDTTHCWKRANLHTHTRVEGLMNECEYSADSIYNIYKSYGYDIIGFTNHNELTVHPIDPSLQMNIYEHGMNALNYHIMAYGAESVWYYDISFPLLTSQKQFIIDELSDDADIVQFNHPHRTLLLSREELEKLGGYQLMELTSEYAKIENEHWDWALTAGHYSHGILNDDLHFPNRAMDLAVRCSFLCTPADDYESVRNTLLEGCFYSMRVPNYGSGNWEVKHEHNKHLPEVRNIGLRDNTIFIELSQRADSIKFVGAGHRTLHIACDTTTAEYTMLATDPYARITAFYNDRAVIFSNVFARYDSTTTKSPYRPDTYSVNITLTILFNLAIALIIAMIITLIYKVIRR